MKITKLKDLKHEKLEVDAKGQVLGRLATKVANLLVGKSKSYFVRHLDCGDFVTVKNADKVVVTGKKFLQKKYTSYSGYPAGLKTKTMAELSKIKPFESVRKAVLGMLPNNKLRDIWITRLKFI